MPSPRVVRDSLASMLAENGRMDEAILRFQTAIKSDPTYARAYAAMGEALLLQGRLNEAQTAIGRCVELFPEDDPAHAAAVRHLQRCKAIIALDGRLAGVLQGKDKPASVGECLQFAQVCRIRKRYTAAARLAAEAFSRAPALAADLRIHHRYNAACAAALAGCGLGADALERSDAERTEWRKQAREWLQADLALWTKKFDTCTAVDRLLVHKSMRHWQVDPDLAALRDPSALDKLSAAERTQWLALWNDVTAVLGRAEGTN
jgi:eukaryotic-like serine/threonine-protein kinase